MKLNLNDSIQLELDKLIEEYRDQLLINAYKKEYVRKRIDTTITSSKTLKTNFNRKFLKIIFAHFSVKCGSSEP